MGFCILQDLVELVRHRSGYDDFLWHCMKLKQGDFLTVRYCTQSDSTQVLALCIVLFFFERFVLDTIPTNDLAFEFLASKT